MFNWLSIYNETFGMYNASLLTTIFGAFAVTFTVIMCWGKLVEDFGPIGGMMSAAIIIGTFWIMNHKLPGFGIHPEQLKDATGRTMQFSLIYQNGPWIDMGWAIAIGLWVCGLVDGNKHTSRWSLLTESLPRIGVTILGGIIGGMFVGLLGYTNAQLFGWDHPDMVAPIYQSK